MKKNVLREKVGNELIICNTSNKKDYLCKIEEISEFGKYRRNAAGIKQ